MAETSDKKTAWSRFACAFENLGAAFLKLAEGVSQSPPEYRIAGLCVAALVFIFGFVTIRNSQSPELYLVAAVFAILILVILKMCLDDSHKAKVSEDGSLGIIRKKTDSYEDDVI